MYTLPKLQVLKTKTDTIAEFKGLNERAAIEDNELADCYNVSLENAPALSVRDGYEEYIAPEALGDMWVRSVRDHMIIKHNDVWKLSFFDRTTGLRRTEEISLSEDMPIGFDLYNNELYFLLEPDADGTFYLKSFDFMYTIKPVGTVKTHVITGTEVFNEYDGKSPVCFMAFGNRMIIAYKGEIAISFDDNISDWTTYKVEGYATEECAQRFQLLDDGDFISCVNYRDYPIFFKKNSMYILYGEYAPFSLSRIDSVGCPYPDTIAVCNGALYFLSKLGVMEYTGGTPKLISQNVNLSSVSSLNGHTACADNRYYYIANLAFDTYTRTWSKTFMDSAEIDPEVVSSQLEYYPQCYFDNQVYFLITENVYDPGASQITYRSIVHTSEEQSCDWSFTTKQFHEYQAGKKIISRLVVGFENVGLSELKIEVSLDKGDFKTVYTWDGSKDFVKEVPVILPPCDYFQLRVSGTGKAYVHYIKRIYRVLGR